MIKPLPTPADPNDQLNQLRQHISRCLVFQDYIGSKAPAETPSESLDKSVEELAEAFEVLDNYLSSGGALPDAWGRGRALIPSLDILR